MILLSDLDAALADIKSTPTGLVEYNSNSLQTVEGLVRDILAQRGVPTVPDIATIESLNSTECSLVYMTQVGLFEYCATADLPVYNTIKYPTPDGLGYWIPIPLATLSSLLTGAPATGNVPTWNGTHWVPAAPTVASLGWSNITAKPTPLNSTNLHDTDQLLKKFDVSGGSFESIGRVQSGLGNIRLFPLVVNAEPTGQNSILAITEDVRFLQDATDSLAAVTNQDINSGSDYSLTGSVIIGNPGDLSADVTASALTHVMAVGVNGIQAVGVDKNGNVYINRVGAGTVIIRGATTITGAVTITGATAVTGNLSVSATTSVGALVTSGTTTHNSAVNITAGSVALQPGIPLTFGGWTTGTRPAVAGGIFPMGFNTTVGKMEYWNGSTWTSFP